MLDQEDVDVFTPLIFFSAFISAFYFLRKEREFESQGKEREREREKERKEEERVRNRQFKKKGDREMHM